MTLWTSWVTHFLKGKAPVLSQRACLSVTEDMIIRDLNRVVKANPKISFGSYPVSQGSVKTIITMEAAGGDEASLKEALAALLNAIPEDSLVEVSDSASLLSNEWRPSTEPWP